MNYTPKFLSSEVMFSRKLSKFGKIPDKDREQLTPEEIEQLVILGSKRREERPDYWIHLLQKDIVSKNP